MGISSRDYYRETTQSAWMLPDAPVVKYIILINVAVFLLQIFTTRDARSHGQARESVVEQWLIYDTDMVMKQGQVWRLVTCAFCHDRLGLFHILFNMLFLYWFGCEVEALYGSREFLLFYLTAAVAASLTHLALNLATGTTNEALGASGAVMAVTMLFTLHYPRHVILLFFILPIQMRWLMALFLVWDLHPVLLMLSGENVRTGIGHAAHLGGLGFAFFYYRFQWRLDRSAFRVPAAVRRQVAPRARLRIAPGTAPEPEQDDRDRVDRILAKISRSGQDSLTADERAILRAESDRIRRRNR